MTRKQPAVGIEFLAKNSSTQEFEKTVIRPLFRLDLRPWLTELVWSLASDLWPLESNRLRRATLLPTFY